MALLTMFRGDHVTLDITVTLNSLPYDLTGKKLKFTVKRFFRDVDANKVFQLDSDVAGEILYTDPTQGIAEATIVPAKTSGLSGEIHRLRYDLQLLDGTKPYTLDSGHFVVNPDVTIGV